MHLGHLPSAGHVAEEVVKEARVAHAPTCLLPQHLNGGNIQGTFREHSGNIQGTFREHSGNIQGVILRE
jgi:hypothetical protein